MLNERDKELIKACKEGHMYDFIANNAYRFSKEELVEILKQTYYAIYQRLGDQAKEVEQKIPYNLMDYDFFEEGLTTAEQAYLDYLSGGCSYECYLRVCKQEQCEPEPGKI